MNKITKKGIKLPFKITESEIGCFLAVVDGVGVPYHLVCDEFEVDGKLTVNYLSIPRDYPATNTRMLQFMHE